MKSQKKVDKSSGLGVRKDPTRGKPPASASIQTGSPRPLLPASSTSADLFVSTLPCNSCDKLRKENVSLTSELESLRDLYQQLVQESKIENYSERRVNLLKAHVTQLERQLTVLSQALSRRSTLLVDVEQSLAVLEQKIKCIQSAAVCPERGHLVMDRVFVDALDAIRNVHATATRAAQVSLEDVRSCPVAYAGLYVATEPGKEVTVMDIIGSGRPSHPLSYRQTSLLEGQLSQLYQCLCKLEASCLSIPSPKTSQTSDPLVSLLSRFSSHVTKCHGLVGEIGQHLLTLSLLVPGQVPHRVKLARFFSVDTLLKQLPPFSRDKREARELLQQLLTHFNHVCQGQDERITALEEEALRHRSHEEQQLTHLASVFSTLSAGYSDFVSSIEQLILEPLQAILTAYEHCLQEPSEPTGSTLLAILSQHLSQLRGAVTAISEMSKERGSTALLQFAKEFTSKATPPLSSGDAPAIN